MSGTILLVMRFIIAVTLYGFIAWILYTLWQDLKRQSEQLAARTPPTLNLLPITEGEAKPTFFTKPEISLGRDPACDLHLDDGTASAQHARIFYRQKQWWVEDLNSRNGTFLNEEFVSIPLVITNGDQLRCGQIIFTISIGE